MKISKHGGPRRAITKMGCITLFRDQGFGYSLSGQIVIIQLTLDYIQFTRPAPFGGPFRGITTTAQRWLCIYLFNYMFR